MPPLSTVVSCDDLVGAGIPPLPSSMPSDLLNDYYWYCPVIELVPWELMVYTQFPLDGNPVTVFVSSISHFIT